MKWGPTIAGALGVVIAGVLIHNGANTLAAHAGYAAFSGVCSKTGNYTSDDDYIEMAVEMERRYPSEGADVKWPYASLEAFHQSNPSCCSVTRWQRGGAYEVTDSVRKAFAVSITERMKREYNVLVHLEYRASGKTDRSTVFANYVIDACGEIVSKDKRLE